MAKSSSIGTEMAIQDFGMTMDRKRAGAMNGERAGRAAREAIYVACAVAAIAAFAFAFTDPFVVTLAGYTCAFALFALSINIILGGVGEVPLGQCLFFGVGAYGAAIGMGKLGLPFEVAVLIALVLSVVLAAIIGVITLRLTGAYFSIVSWGLTGVAMVAATKSRGDHRGTARPVRLSADRDRFAPAVGSADLLRGHRHHSSACDRLPGGPAPVSFRRRHGQCPPESSSRALGRRRCGARPA
ncbi:branched-chain amino acid ABC transporter permease [Bradyrhizobium sp. USDA 3650]